MFLGALFILALQGPAQAAPYAAYVMDAKTGETLYAKNADTRLHPASLTKMLHDLHRLRRDPAGRGFAGYDDHGVGPRGIAAAVAAGAEGGQRIALRHLIRAAAIKSANDAASAIGDGLSGNEESSPPA